MISETRLQAIRAKTLDRKKVKHLKDSVYLPKSLIDRIKVISKERGISRNQAYKFFLTEGLNCFEERSYLYDIEENAGFLS
jgi:hypothetical protein